MNITSAKYMVDPIDTDTTVGVRVIIDDKTYDVPIAQGNRHYAEIMRQVETGTLTIAPADEEQKKLDIRPSM